MLVDFDFCNYVNVLYVRLIWEHVILTYHKE